MPGEFDALTCEPVEIRRRGIASVKSHVRPAEVVGDDKDNVRFRVGGVECGEWGEKECEKECFQGVHGMARETDLPAIKPPL